MVDVMGDLTQLKKVEVCKYHYCITAVKFKDSTTYSPISGKSDMVWAAANNQFKDSIAVYIGCNQARSLKIESEL